MTTLQIHSQFESPIFSNVYKYNRSIHPKLAGFFIAPLYLLDLNSWLLSLPMVTTTSLSTYFLFLKLLPSNIITILTVRKQHIHDT